MSRDELVALARQIAELHGLDQALVCALCEQESGWDPFAIRYEPLFLDKYVKPLVGTPQFWLPPGVSRDTELWQRSVSWGLMQTMGQVARELRCRFRFLSTLCDAPAGLEYGCRELKRCLEIRDGDVDRALLRYNGGGRPQYPSEIKAKMTQYI